MLPSFPYYQLPMTASSRNQEANATDTLIDAGNTLPRTVCKDADAVAGAVKDLQWYRYIACSCVGVDLGAAACRLSLIVLAGISNDDRKPHVFLIDTRTLDSDSLGPVFEFLHNIEQTKVMFDSRVGWATLFHRYGLRLGQVLDLQLADIQSRRMRGESKGQRLARLSPFCNKRDIKRHQAAYEKLHFLNTLDAAASEHGFTDASDLLKPDDLTARILMARPLSNHTIQSAVNEVYLILRLYQRLVEKKFIVTQRTVPLLLRHSARYMTFYKESPKIPGEEYPILPPNIIFTSPANVVKASCRVCSQEFPTKCFPRTRGRSLTDVCIFCHAIASHRSDAQLKSEEPTSEGTSNVDRPASPAPSPVLVESESRCSRRKSEPFNPGTKKKRTQPRYSDITVPPVSALWSDDESVGGSNPQEAQQSD